MTKSLITRCPKCSTAFRVNDDVLGMAKGKVRCGQCFHIFDAKQYANQAPEKAASESNTQAPSATQSAPPETARPSNQTNTSEQQTPEKRSTMLFTSADEEPVNPEWLQTLFTEDDLSPGSVDDIAFSHNSTQNRTEEANNTSPSQSEATTNSTKTKEPDSNNANTADAKAANSSATANKKAQQQRADDDLAPWERELAEIEKSIAHSSARPTTKKEGTLKGLKQSDIQDRIEDSLNTQTAEPEPDYMLALHSLAQNASEQSLPTNNHYSGNSLNSLSAQETLDPLLGEYQKEQLTKKSSKTWLWTLGTLLGLAILAGQVATHFFVEGSHSETFRTFYRTICTYTGCTLAPFENIKTISIQHVRIQSHPTQPNALLVNAIMTNNSNFAQPMPKIALEFFDLNGAPVAARLFAPKNYLDKDFLDITYMPPKTPIHIVIPIQDPGDRAVTHQLRVFPTNTRSY